MLRDKKEELGLFFNVSLDLLCVANKAGYFVRLNRAFERILGYTTDELMAKPFIEFVHPEDRDVTKEELAKLGLQKKLFDFTNRYRCKDGNFRWFEWRAVPSGGLIYAAARDVTDRIRSAGELADRLQFRDAPGRNFPGALSTSPLSRLIQKLMMQCKKSVSISVLTLLPSGNGRREIHVVSL